MKNVLSRYGMIAGFLMTGIFLLVFLILNNDPANYELEEVIGYVNMVLCLLAIYFGIKKYRDSVGNGSITFLDALKVGLGIAGIASLIFAIYNLIYVEILNPQFIENYYSYYVEKIQNSDLPAAEIKAQLSQLEADKDFFTNSLVSSLVMFVTVFMIGVVITLISGAILRKPETPVNQSLS